MCNNHYFFLFFPLLFLKCKFNPPFFITYFVRQFLSSTTIVPIAIVQLSYIKLLEEIAEKLSIENPQCEVTLIGEEWFLAYIELEIAHVGSVVEVVCCWDGPSPDIHQKAKEDAARFTIEKMKSKFDLQIKDVNYDDYILYKNMHNDVTIQYTDLLTRFNNLGQEYNGLKDCHASTLADNAKFVTKQLKMQHSIDEYRASVNHFRRGCSVSTTDPSEEDSASGN